ncbi:MAG: hypothetical protein ACREF4_18455, partial [Gammaproteobacteria bacterium]
VPAHFAHIPLTADPAQLPPRTRYLLAGYYGHEDAVRLAQRIGCSLLFVRYNVELFNRALKIQPGERRYFVTRDRDNAEATREFFGSAYPEMPLDRYEIVTANEWLHSPDARRAKGEVWTTITAAPLVRDSVQRPYLRLLHPLLAQDFVDELRYLALLARSV